MKNPRRTPDDYTPYPISATRIRMQVICAVLIPATPLLTLHSEGLMIDSAAEVYYLLHGT